MRKQPSLVGRYALFYVFSRHSRGRHLSKVLDVQGNFVLLQDWSKRKDEKLPISLPALFPLSILAVEGALPWSTVHFDEEYLENNTNAHFAKLFPDWKSAKGELEIEQTQEDARRNTL